MKIIVNRRIKELPDSIADITLGQRIRFQQEHGDLLSEMHTSIMAIEDEQERELELSEFQYETMIRTFSFFTDIDVAVLKNCEFTEEIAEVYYGILLPLFYDKIDVLQTSFTWKSEEWVLPQPQLKQGSPVYFGEFIDSKQCIQDMADAGKALIERLLPLCAIYLRKKDEAYQEEFLYDNSERLELMKDLPMDIALHVGFFLNSSMVSSKITSRSSGHRELKVPGKTARGISSAGDGSIFLKASPKQKCLMFPAPVAIRLRAPGLPGFSMS